MVTSNHPAASLLRHLSGRLSCRAVLTVLLVGLTGCAGIASAPQPFGTETNALQTADAYFAATLERYLKAQQHQQQQKEIRNGFIETRTALIDQAYAGFRQTLYTQRVDMNVGVDLATLGLNAVGAVTGSLPAKTGLHALSGGLIGSKASIDKNVFFDRTMPALLAQMEAQRSAVRLRLLGGMMVGPDRYPLMQARADLEEYYVAGTMVGAIGSITTQAMVEQKSRADDVASRLPSKALIEKQLKAQGFNVKAAVNDPAGFNLLTCWTVEDDAAEQANQAAFREWWQNNGVPKVAADLEADFFILPEWADKRKAAAADKTLTDKLRGCSPAGS